MGAHKCEAHNWVIDEEGCPVCEGMEIVKKRVQELHKSELNKISHCGWEECCGPQYGEYLCVECWVDYPCDTIKALNGETE